MDIDNSPSLAVWTLAPHRRERRGIVIGGTLVGVPLSARLADVFDALPLRSGMRVLEIGCGPGALARAIAERVGPAGHVLAIDRSATAIDQARRAATGVTNLEFRVATIEEFELAPGESLFDLAVAIRVGALDGRHPAAGELAVPRVRAALVTGAPCFLDGGDPLRPL